MKRQHMVVGTALLTLLGLSLLSGCGPKAADPGTPAEREKQNAEALSKENTGSGTTGAAGDHGNISGENAAPPPAGR